MRVARSSRLETHLLWRLRTRRQNAPKRRYQSTRRQRWRHANTRIWGGALFDENGDELEPVRLEGPGTLAAITDRRAYTAP
jgi:hypothetical protein